MNVRTPNGLRALVLAIALLTVPPAVAHEGEQHGTPAPGAATYGGPIRLTEQAKTNLGLQTEEAQLRTIETLVRCFGIVEAVPDKVNFVSIRTSGRATKVMVNQGDRVKEGDLLAEVEGRLVSNPPATISVRATLAGIVTQRNLFVGESIEPEKQLFQIADLSQVRVKCQVYEADVGKVRLGQRARFHFEAYPDRTFDGAVEFLAGELEANTRSLPVWSRLDNSDLTLRPNMRADARVVIGGATDALAVPIQAVLGDAGTYFVYVDRGDIYERAPVVLGQRDDRYVEIVDGLVPGDRVVTQGNYQLQFAVSAPPAGPSATGTPTGAKP